MLQWMEPLGDGLARRQTVSKDITLAQCQGRNTHLLLLKRYDADPANPVIAKLATFVDYNLTTSGQFVNIRVGNYYVTYNRAKGINENTMEYPDKILVVEMLEGPEMTLYHNTELLAALDADTDTTFRVENFNNTNQPLIVQVCETVAGPPDFAKVAVGLDADCDADVQTQSPTVPPTNPPPEVENTSAPTSVPTSPPTEPPTVPPTQSPGEVTGPPTESPDTPEQDVVTSPPTESPDTTTGDVVTSPQTESPDTPTGDVVTSPPTQSPDTPRGDSLIPPLFTKSKAKSKTKNKIKTKKAKPQGKAKAKTKRRLI